ncbi:MAG: FG-GAP-like repeat-containing protein [Candidatus Nanoarchaeia archaeon]|jgi:alpha-tubulin suppressor-like RCC1 family protein
MKAITPIISVVLLILITVFASVSAYFFITSTMNDLEGGINLNTAFSDNSKLSIISLSGSKAIIKNDGKSSISEVIVFLNGEMFNYTFNPALPGGEAAEMYFSPQLAGEDLELIIFYGIGKTVSYTSPAAANTNDSGFVTATIPVVVLASIVDNTTQLLGYCQASVYNASIESIYYYEWLLDEELNSSGSAIGNHDNENYLLSNITSAEGSWKFKCLIGNGTYNSSWKLSAAVIVGESGSNEPDDTLIYCLSNNSRNTWFSGSITGNNGACCGDDRINDVFHNNSYLCSYGGVIYDEDNLYTEDNYGDYYDYSSGKGVCELNGNVWFENPVSFEDDVSYGLGPVLIDVELSDFDNDGDLDIVVLNQYDVSYTDAVFRVLFNDGDGLFSGTTVYVVDGNIVDLSIADINNDGYNDILIVNYGGSELDVYLNDGDGTFTYDSYVEISWPWKSIVGDLDNDGDLDVIASTYFDDDISVFLNDGTGSLSYDDDWSDLGGAGDLKLADLNFDGNLDVINADSNSDSIRYRLGVGDGTFGSLNTLNVGTNPIGLGIGDLDKDGDLDIIASNNGSDSFSVCLGDGAGSFAEDVEYDFDYAPTYITLGDLDNDGDLDVLATTQLSNNFMISFNDGDGTFGSSTLYGLSNSTYAIAVGDLDNDGDLDAAFTHFQNDYYKIDHLLISLNTGITGTKGPCCGDDEATDDFYNSTNYCCNGAFNTGSCYCGDGVCQAWESELSCSEDCIFVFINNVSIVSFNYGLRGYCNASSSNELETLAYEYNWSKNGEIFLSGIMFRHNSITSSKYNSCGLLENGSAMCWGRNDYGQLGTGDTTLSNVPVYVSGGYNFSEIASGDEYSCGLLTNGSVMCWGSGSNGHLGNGGNSESHVPVFVRGNYVFKELSSIKLEHTCGILTNGRAVCWGDGDYGDLGNGGESGSNMPVFVSGNYEFLEISTGMYHTCGILINGSAMCWGSNYYSQLGITGASFSYVPIFISEEYSFRAISAGWQHTCGILTNGSAVCWGYNNHGQLGNGEIGESYIPVFVNGNYSFIDISAGNIFTCGVLANNSAVCWGDNYYGQLGNGSSGGQSSVPVFVNGGYNFSVINSGAVNDFSCAVMANGSAACWGYNGNGQFGNGSSGGISAVPMFVSGAHNFSAPNYYNNKNLLVSQVSLDNYYYLQGGLLIFSCRVKDYLGDYSGWMSQEINLPVPSANNASIVEFSYGLKGYCNITSNYNNDLLKYNFTWKVNGASIINNINFKQSSYSLGERHSCDVLENGSVVCWGEGGYGQLGNGLDDSSNDPVFISGGYNFTKVSSNTLSVCGILGNASAVCWGYNNYGQLGNGGTGYSNLPVFVSGGYNFSDLRMGGYHSCGVLFNGSAVCWGYGIYGELGNGTSLSSSVPVFVAGGYNFSSISVSQNNGPGTGSHSCGILINGSAVCWGLNEYGQLGNGSSGGQSNVPVFVTGNYKFASINTGYKFTCGVLLNGSVVCWGYGEDGELGNGGSSSSSTPVLVNGGYRFVSISVSKYYACGLLINSSAACWGYNGYGQFGNGGTESTNSPVIAGTGYNFSQIATGNSHACGVLINGSKVCWGYNTYGQLGNGSSGGQSNVPVFVTGNYNFVNNSYYWNKNDFVSMLPSNYYSSGNTVVFECITADAASQSLPKNMTLVI